MLLSLWSPKGGSGTSVVVAALALVAAGRGESRLADLGGDQPAILGLPPTGPPGAGDDGLVGWLTAGSSAPTERLDGLAVAVGPGLSVLPRGSGPLEVATAEAGAALAVALRDGYTTVVDAGAVMALMVIRPCYLALRRAVADPRLSDTNGAVLVEEPGRALDADDVAAVLGVPVVGRVPCRAEIARAVDAGVLGNRLPAALAGPAGALLDRLPELVGGRWAA